MSDELEELTKDVDAEATTKTDAATTVPDVEATVDEKGEEEVVVPPTTSDPSVANVPVAALLDERERRQLAEAELAQLKASEVVPRPDASEDPEGAVTHLESIVEARMWDLRTSLSRDMMAGQHPDYAEKEQAFVKMADANPQLVSDMFKSDNPARFAYETARKHEEYQALQNVDEVKAKMREEVKAELKAEIEAKGEADALREKGISAATDIPSLATTTGATTGFTSSSDDDDLSNVALGDNI